MDMSISIKAHVDKALLLKDNMTKFPLADTKAQTGLFDDLDKEVKLLYAGKITQNLDARLVPGVQNVQDTYQRLMYQAVTAQKVAFEKQQQSLMSEQTQIVVEEENKDADSPSHATPEVDVETVEVSEEASVPATSEAKLKDLRNSLAIYHDFQNISMERLCAESQLSREKPYGNSVALFDLDDWEHTLSDRSKHKGFAAGLDFLGREDAVAVVWAEPDEFETWRKIFCDLTEKSKKWVWWTTMTVVKHPSAATRSRGGWKRLCLHAMVLYRSRQELPRLNLASLEAHFDKSAVSFDSNVVLDYKVLEFFSFFFLNLHCNVELCATAAKRPLVAA